MNAVQPGSVGGSYAYHHSLLYQKIANGEAFLCTKDHRRHRCQAFSGS